MIDVTAAEEIACFADDSRRAVYDAIRLRRDVRHFDPTLHVDDDLLARLLGAAHLAPSVGFSQPWAFVVVRDEATRARVRESFLRCREAEAARFPDALRAKYLALRLEGILEAPLNVCVAVDLRDRPEAILGTTVQPESVRASACCAVQNLWLAARAEGIGVGWVSIVEPAVLRRELALPPGVEPVAYLCVGHPRAFRGRPMLEELGWRPRRALEEVVHDERFEDTHADAHAHAHAPAQAHAPVPPRSHDAMTAAAARWDTLTKPRGSLGRLEDIATWFAGARDASVEPPKRRALALFLADHGVAAEAVSAYPSSVTAAMACNVMAGGAAVSVLARRRGVDLHAVDVGIAGDTSGAPLSPRVPLARACVRAGTGNLRRERAMSTDEATRAMRVGAAVAETIAASGATLAGVGEIGIANTTSAAALVSVFTGAPPELTCGAGTGLDEAARARKVDVVRDALELHRPRADAPLDALAAVGGLEIAAIAGFILRAAALRVPVVLDGYVTNAAALVARAFEPRVTGYLLASHRSAERGATIALDALGLAPLLALDMRLGEGTGALLAMDLADAALALHAEMATFATAGIVRGTP